MIGCLNSFSNLFEIMRNPNKENISFFIDLMEKKRKERSLETELFVQYVSRSKKAKKRGRFRVEKNYINVCSKLNVKPWGFMTEEEKEYERCQGFYY